MGKNKYLVLLIALITISSQSLFSQEVDTRVWSRHYWENIVKTPPPFKVRDIEKQPAAYKGSIIDSRNIKYTDSPDVPVTSDMNDYQSENSIFVSPLGNQIVLNSNNSTHTGGVYGASGYFTF
ncbi:MAG: hypothetical protein KAR38_01740, partial [Calditrichia bacterium]|nr:hypothetical protein [Calditrichia bacterium]